MSSEKTRFTEQQFNAIVAGCMWSSSWFVASAFLVVLLGIPVPEWLIHTFMWVVSTVAPLFLTVGMYQVWRLTDPRRWLAVPASLFLILSAVLIFGAVVSQNRVKEYRDALALARESVEWQTAKASYDAVLQDYNTLAAREFPADYPTQFGKNETAKATAWSKVEEKSAALKKLEPTPGQATGGAFDILGPDNAVWVFSVFLALYSIVNEIMAMALSHRRSEKAPRKARESTQETLAPATTLRVVMPFGVDQYIEVAKRLGRNGLLAGARAVAEETGQTEWTCKTILRQAIEQGKIRVRGDGKAPEVVNA